jgi:hypothetical protein
MIRFFSYIAERMRDFIDLRMGFHAVEDWREPSDCFLFWLADERRPR